MPEKFTGNRFVSHLTPKKSQKFANLVGERCIINCNLDGKQIQALWDTGAQVSILSENFVRENFPSTKIKEISELLDCDLNVTAANGSSIPYLG